MEKSKYSVFILAASLILALLFIPACSQKELKPEKPQASDGQKPEAPPETDKLLEELDEIISELDKMIKSQNMPHLQSRADSSPTTKPPEPEKGHEAEEKQKKASASSSEADEGKKQEAASGLKNTWPTINQGIKKIHKNWNRLEPEAVEAGLSLSSRKRWEQSLSDLTIAGSKQDPEESLMAATSLYQTFAEVAQVFSMPLPPDYFRVKYGVMAAMLESVQFDWEKAALHIPEIQENWESLKVQAKALEPQPINCCDFALRDLEEAINRQQRELVLIKGEICLENLKELEEKFQRRAMSKKSQGNRQK